MMKRFKIWHKSMKDFIEHKDIYSVNLYAEIVTVSDVDESGYGASRSTDIPFSELEFLYSTGIKDKNGVEIYEGDVLAGNYLVELSNSAFMLKNKEGDYFYMPNKITYSKVIGNIHQNPELLEK